MNCQLVLTFCELYLNIDVRIIVAIIEVFTSLQIFLNMREIKVTLLVVRFSERYLNGAVGLESLRARELHLIVIHSDTLLLFL